MASNQTPNPRPDADFKLSITRALADQLQRALETLTPATLTSQAISELQNRPGVYALFLDGERVYVGKASRSLTARLGKHLRKLSGRSGFANRLTFICLYVDEDLEASAPEKMLIKAYRTDGGAPWNTNGFGNNDPGKQRDTSRIKANHFDALFPINLSLELSMDDHIIGSSDALTLLTKLKEQLPYLLRYDNARPDVLRKAGLTIPAGPLKLADWLELLVTNLPSGWQATALPGYVIVYPEKDPDRYPSAISIWRNESGKLIARAGAAEQGPSTDENEEWDRLTTDSDDG
ncbi:hypothetical protein [Rhodococcus sp. IEGM1428]|uniref:hypothetical protein n=1 Tax=Rhodococcus sp. IEGM1428 TaxID=3392191 RepID=UPI003D14546A